MLLRLKICRLQKSPLCVWHRRESDCKGSFQVLICKGKEMIALTFVISMRLPLMFIKAQKDLRRQGQKRGFLFFSLASNLLLNRETSVET